MSKIEDIFSSIRAATKERVSTPIGGYIFLSWIGWNHKLAMALLFANSLEERYELLQKIYPDSGAIFHLWILNPLLTGLTILFIIPILHFLVSLWQHLVNASLKKAQHKIRSPEIIPVEKLRAIEEEIENLEYEKEKVENSLTRKVYDLEEENTKLLNENTKTQQQLRNQSERILQLEAKNGKLSVTEKSILLTIAESNEYHMSDSEVMNKCNLNVVEYNLYRKRLYEDLHFIQPFQTDKIQLVKDGISAVVKIKESTNDGE